LHGPHGRIAAAGGLWRYLCRGSASHLAAWVIAGERRRAARQLLSAARVARLSLFATAFRRGVTQRSRQAAVAGIAHGEMPGRLSLFLSNEPYFAPALYPYLGWDRVFGAIDLLRMEIAHDDFFAPANAEGLIEAIVAHGRIAEPAALAC
jgi:hypothetical protein